MRYYVSKVGGEGRQAVVYLSGDRGGIVPGSSKYNEPDAAKDVDTRSLVRRADMLSKAARAPGIYLARMGIDGSSGHHVHRRTYLEVAITDAAVSELKRRHGFTGLHLVGQSGGSTLVAALLATRRDVDCAVLGAGLLGSRGGDEPRQRNDRKGDPGLQRYQTVSHLMDVVSNPRARIVVITDPEDQRVKRVFQDDYVHRLVAAGRQVEQHYVQATDENHHSVWRYSIYAAGQCARGRNQHELGEALQRYVTKRE
jgi:hypothetical protein